MPLNLLTLNQSDGTESAALTGVVTTGAGSTLSSSTAQKFSGSRSVLCTCAGSGTGEGVKTTTTAINLQPEPMTFQAKVYVSVACQVTITGTSAAASFTATNTVAVPATTWTTIQCWGTPSKAVTDGVLTVKTGETKAVSLYVDELGAWFGIGGNWAPGGGYVTSTAGGNSNTTKYYAGLAPISDVEEQAIAAGTSDAQIDWF